MTVPQLAPSAVNSDRLSTSSKLAVIDVYVQALVTIDEVSVQGHTTATV